jgi:pre-mycofactocin synthase
VVKALALGARGDDLPRLPVRAGRQRISGSENVFDVPRGGIDSTLLALGRSSVHDLSGEDIIVPGDFSRGMSKFIR